MTGGITRTRYVVKVVAAAACLTGVTLAGVFERDLQIPTAKLV
jgi:hypothetical protein